MTGRFFTTEPPGKPYDSIYMKQPGEAKPQTRNTDRGWGRAVQGVTAPRAQVPLGDENVLEADGGAAAHCE